VAILALLLGLGGCRREKPAGQTKQSATPGRPIEVPKEVLATIGLRNPGSSVDDLLSIARVFTPLPLDRAAVFDLLARRTRLPTDLLGALDPGGTFWMVILDEKQVGERDPGVAVFPLRSRQELEGALSRRMQRAGSEGDLVLYTPKQGEEGQPLRLLLTDKHAIAPSSKKALDLTRAFLERNLVPRPPSYDLAVHVMVENLFRGPARDLDRDVARALERVRASSAPGAAIDRAPVADAAQDAVQHYLSVLRSMRELIITADVDSSQLTLAVRGEARPGGLLHGIVKRQQPGPVFGQEIMPGSSWLVLSNRSNPEAAAERQKSWTTTVRGLFSRSEPAQASRLQAALIELGERFSGDLTLALHRGGAGSGVGVSAVAKVKGAKEVRAALERLLAAAADWLSEGTAAAGRSGEAAAPSKKQKRRPKLERRAFSHKDAKGTIYELRVPYPEEHHDQLTRLLGERLSFGWAVVGELALFTAGKDVEAQLEQLAEGAAGGKVEGPLAEQPAFRRAATAGPSRIGMLFVSLLGLARWFEGSGIEEAEKIAAALKDRKVASAPSLDWGVATRTQQLDVTLRLPVDHFRAFKPILDELLRQRSLGGGLAPSKWTRP